MSSRASTKSSESSDRLLLLGLGVIAAIAYFVRNMGQRNASGLSVAARALFAQADRRS